MRRLLSSTAFFGVFGAVGKINPIRRVVTLLQEMEEDLKTQLEKEKRMYEKFDCYCKKNDGALDQKSQLAQVTIQKTRFEVESLTAQKKQLKEELKKHSKDRDDARKRWEQATAERTEEKTKYDQNVGESKKTLEDLDKAVAALERGMGKAFLQTNSARYLRKVLMNTVGNNAVLQNSLEKLDAGEQQQIVGFLQAGENKDYAAQGGEIVGILKMMKDNIDEDLGGIVSEEEAAVKAFTELKTSLESLIRTGGETIEKKQIVKGEVAVKIVEGKNLVTVTEKQMSDDMKTLMDLKESCGAKNDEFNARQADAAAEIDAINQAVAVLNDDDALQIFNKSDPNESFAQEENKSSLLQTAQRAKSPSEQASDILRSMSHGNKSVAMLAFSAEQTLKTNLRSHARQAVDFSSVLKMIDEMVGVLKQEATDDLKSRDECNQNLNDSDQDKKETERALEGLDAQIDSLGQSISAQEGVIAKSDSDIATAKTAMAESTEQRKDENAEFITAVDLNKQAVELIQKAKNKLNAFYNPQLVPSEAPEQMTAQEEIFEASRNAFIQRHSRSYRAYALEQQPGTVDKPEMWDEGARKTQGQKGNSVLALMDMLANDISKDTQTLESDEQVAQRDYEKLQMDLATQISESQQAMADATKTKTNNEENKLNSESTRSMKDEELQDIKKTIMDLHTKCDFLIGAFEERRQARENEIAGLNKAKSILKGANFDG